MIIGGKDSSDPDYLSTMKTEIWELDNGVNNIIRRKIIDTNLPNNRYSNGIALFEVDANFCKKVTG